MNPLPDAARDVVREIRATVARPQTLPTRERVGDFCSSFRWRGFPDGEPRCPMGLHPRSESPAPYSGGWVSGFGPHDDGVAWFADWWDDIEPEDLNEAMDLIWPVQS